MERCPTCQARLREPPVCARCGTDLSLPLAVEAEASARLRLALARLAEGDVPAARRAVKESLRLKREPLAVALRGFLMERAPAVGCVSHPTRPEPIGSMNSMDDDVGPPEILWR